MSDTPPKLLLVEDDDSFGYILKEYLMLHGYIVSLIKDGKAAIKKISEEDFDLCIFDIMLPGADGFEIAGKLKHINPDTPFIFLTSRSLKVDKLKGFQHGCDDYETKPVDEEVLLAKIQAILNRSSRTKNEMALPEIFNIGNYKYDSASRILSNDNDKKILTEREASLLALLFQNKNRLLDRKKVLKEIWGIADLFSRKSMDVFITKLRKYLSGDERIKIINVHNKGFIFQVPEK